MFHSFCFKKFLILVFYTNICLKLTLFYFLLFSLVAIGDFSAVGNIKVFNESLTLVKTFNAHSGIINRIKQLPNGYVARASADNAVKIWNVITPSNWSLILTFTRHTSSVIGLEYINAQTIGRPDFTILEDFYEKGHRFYEP